MSKEKVSATPSTTHSPGNTNAGSARHFQVVVNEAALPHYEDIKAYLCHWKALNYYLCTEHIGGPNKHYHIYVQYTYPVKMKYTELHGAHVDKCFGTPQQNYDYLMCQDAKHPEEGITAVVIDEEGTIRKSGRCPTIREVMKMTPEQRLDELPVNYYNIAKRMNDEQANDITVDDWHKDVEVVWITGHSGAGKSQLAKSIMKNKKVEKFNEVKYVNDFWIGTGSESVKTAVYDDFRDSHMKASEFINFIDYNKHCMNIKGGKRTNDYNLIIITSIQHPNEIYRNMSNEAKEQWLRRIKIIDLNKFDEKPIEDKPLNPFVEEEPIVYDFETIYAPSI